jgi:hypothetical protein
LKIEKNIVDNKFPKPGINVEHLTSEERRRKLNGALYKEFYAQKNNQQQIYHRK